MARGPHAGSATEVLEGEWIPKRLVILEFPDIATSIISVHPRRLLRFNPQVYARRRFQCHCERRI